MGHFDLGEEVNSKKMQVFIGSTSNEWKLVQNARVLVSHPIFREPTTSGGVATYTGAPDNTISGTLLFTRDEWNTASGGSAVTDVAGFAALIAPGSGGEVLARTWLIKLFDVTSNGTDNNELLTFSNCKLSVVDISKSGEGAVKADITVICPGEPATTTTD